jgi:uncharacterized protein YjiS (DUF1127 family)
MAAAQGRSNGSRKMSNPIVRGSVPFSDCGVEIGAARTRPALAINLTPIVRGWTARKRQRQALTELSDHLLRDIGVSPYQAVREAAKWFWQK